MPSAKGQVELVLFDLGEVLVRLGGIGAMQGLASTGAEEEVWDRWLACPWVRSCQLGLCQPEDLASGVVRDLALAISPAEFLERFQRCPRPSSTAPSSWSTWCALRYGRAAANLAGWRAEGSSHVHH